MCFGALGVFWRAWGVLARLVCLARCRWYIFPALNLPYPSGPLLSQAPIPVPVCMLSQCGFGVCFILLFFPLALFYCCPFCFRCFLLFCWWNLQLGRKTCNTIFIFFPSRELCVWTQLNDNCQLRIFVFLILIQQILELTFLSMQMLLVWSLTEIDVNEPDKVRF